MSGKFFRASAAIGVGLLVWPALAQGFDLHKLVADPLRTMPEVVDKGVVLPGDTAPIPCTAQKDFGKPLTLAEAVDLALCNNPRVKSAWADIKVQAGAVGEARAAYLPTLSGSYSFTGDRISYSDTRYPVSNVHRKTAQASASWRVFDFGGRTARREAAQSLLAAALANHNATLQRALEEVIQAYFDAITARADLKAKTENERLTADILKSAKDREAKGVASQTDTLRATTSLAKATLEKNRAQGDYEKGLAVLGQLIGLSGETGITLPQELDGDDGVDESWKELRRWLKVAQESHPAIVAAENQVKAAEEQVTVARSAGLPTLSLTGNYYQNTSPGAAVTSVEAQETTLSLVVSIPFFDGFTTTYKVRGAEAQVEQKKAALADIEQQVAMQVVKAYADATSALRNLEASATLLTAAQSALAVSQRKYDKGAADITEILSTQAALSNARQERVRCLAEWHSARLRLLASAGQMGLFAVTK